MVPVANQRLIDELAICHLVLDGMTLIELIWRADVLNNRGLWNLGGHRMICPAGRIRPSGLIRTFGCSCGSMDLMGVTVAGVMSLSATTGCDRGCGGGRVTT